MKINKKILIFFLAFLVSFSPLISHAFTCAAGTASLATPTNFQQFVCFIYAYISPLIFIVVAGSLLVFFWGIAKFIFAAGSEDAIEEGKTLMIWGVVALFVMISIWGILRLFFDDLFPGQPFGIPQLPE